MLGIFRSIDSLLMLLCDLALDGVLLIVLIRLKKFEGEMYEMDQYQSHFYHYVFYCIIDLIIL